MKRIYKKHKRRSRKNSSARRLFSAAILLFICLIVYLYLTNNDFKNDADSLINKTVKTAQAEVLSQIENRQNTESPQKQAEKSPQPSENVQSSQSQKTVKLAKNLEIPLCDASLGRENPDHQKRDFQYYSICYRESYELAEWSAYVLTAGMLQKNASRTEDFREDPLISTGSAMLSDYKGSGFDRGHLTPAADMSFDIDAMSETFFMSNMTPQNAKLNRGMWKDLETLVRTWANKFGRVYVVSGPLLEKPAEKYESIGNNNVAVPEYYYKVILVPLYADEQDRETPDDSTDIAAIAFVLPNEKCEGKIFDYAVTIDEVEKKTGLDFFSLLEDEKENLIESQIALEYWQ